MNVKELVKELKRIFPVRQYRAGIELEELAFNAGQQTVIDKLEYLCKNSTINTMETKVLDPTIPT